MRSFQNTFIMKMKICGCCQYHQLTNMLFCASVLGTQILSLETKTAVRTNGFSFGGNLIMYTTDKTMGFPCQIHIFDVRDHSQVGKNIFTIVITSHKLKWMFDFVNVSVTIIFEVCVQSHMLQHFLDIQIQDFPRIVKSNLKFSW